MAINVANASAAMRAFMIRLHISSRWATALPPADTQILSKLNIFDGGPIQGSGVLAPAQRCLADGAWPHGHERVTCAAGCFVAAAAAEAQTDLHTSAGANSAQKLIFQLLVAPAGNCSLMPVKTWKFGAPTPER